MGKNHTGTRCTRSKTCGIYGCTKTHNRLPHASQYSADDIKLDGDQKKNPKRSLCNRRVPFQVSSATQTISATEGERGPESERSHTTRSEPKLSQRQEFLAMRTVPVLLKNGSRSMKLNALLDDASTKTYLNADVAAELGLQGDYQKTDVNVLNGQVESFFTMAVKFQLESLDGKVSLQLKPTPLRE